MRLWEQGLERGCLQGWLRVQTLSKPQLNPDAYPVRVAARLRGCWLGRRLPDPCGFFLRSVQGCRDFWPVAACPPHPQQSMIGSPVETVHKTRFQNTSSAGTRTSKGNWRTGPVALAAPRGASWQTAQLRACSPFFFSFVLVCVWFGV